MENITDIKGYTITGIFKTTTSIKQDKDSTESKTLNLNIHINNVSLQDVITKALRPVVISWQNGPGRSKFATWTHNGSVDIDFKSPGKKVKTRDELINDYIVVFMKAGVDKESATELATKAVDQPELIQ